MWRPVAVVSRARSKAPRHSPPCARARQKTAPSCVAEPGRPHGRRSAAPLASSMATTPNNPSRRRPRRTTRSIALRAMPAAACGSSAATMPRLAARQQFGQGRRVGPPHRVDDQAGLAAAARPPPAASQRLHRRARPTRPSRRAASETRDARAKVTTRASDKVARQGRPAARSCRTSRARRRARSGGSGAAMRSRSAIDGASVPGGRSGARGSRRPARRGAGPGPVPPAQPAEIPRRLRRRRASGTGRIRRRPPHQATNEFRRDAPGREISLATVRARHRARHGRRRAVHEHARGSRVGPHPSIGPRPQSSLKASRARRSRSSAPRGPSSADRDGRGRGLARHAPGSPQAGTSLGDTSQQRGNSRGTLSSAARVGLQTRHRARRVPARPGSSPVQIVAPGGRLAGEGHKRRRLGVMPQDKKLGDQTAQLVARRGVTPRVRKELWTISPIA